MTTAVAAPFRFFSLQVVRTRRLGPSLVRVTFAERISSTSTPTGATSRCPSSFPPQDEPSPGFPLSSGTGGGRPGGSSPMTYGR